MDQGTQTFNTLKKLLFRPSTLADHFELLISMQRMGIEEEKHAQARHQMVLDIFKTFLSLLAKEWKCSYDAAATRGYEEFRRRRGLDTGQDLLLSIPYEEYLKSAHWQGVRHYALLRADYRCQLCNSPDRLEVHHRTYQGKGIEDYRDVVALCHDCHARHHDKRQ